jgi:hypothetical protein
MSAVCIITGCALIHHNGMWVSGDLFLDGTTMIFNANVAEDNEPVWFIGQPFYSKTVTPSNWWERRGVFVFSEHVANLNSEAREYIRR